MPPLRDRTPRNGIGGSSRSESVSNGNLPIQKTGKKNRQRILLEISPVPADTTLLMRRSISCAHVC